MRKHLYPRLKRSRFLWMVLSLAAVASLILVACGGGTAASPTPTTAPPTPTATPSPTPSPTSTVMQVMIIEQSEKYAFSPATLTVKVGTQVEWVNMSDAPHTVTPDTAGSFTGTTSSIAKGANFMTTFTTAGTFPYHCSIHPYMMATITVTS